MHNDLLDILSKKELPITNEQLIHYLTGEMGDRERHEMEKVMLDNGIDNDAIEGLQLLHNKEKLHQYQLEISKSLRERLQQKNTTRKKKKVFETPWLVLLTAALLVLIILVWVIIHLLQPGN